MTLREFRDQAGRVIDAVERTQDPVTITKYGRPVAVLISAEEWDEIEAHRDRKDSQTIANARDRATYIPLADALARLGVDPAEVDALLADKSGAAA